jgi:hypothetical protein
MRFVVLERFSAEFRSPTWLSACGKLPGRRRSVGSYSSASRPRSLLSARSFSDERDRFVLAPEQREVVDKPEAADDSAAGSPPA